MGSQESLERRNRPSPFPSGGAVRHSPPDGRRKPEREREREKEEAVHLSQRKHHYSSEVVRGALAQEMGHQP